MLTRDTRTNQHTQLSITGRDVNQTEHVLWFNETECRWYRKGTLEQAVRAAELEEYQLNPIVQDIVDIIADNGGEFTGRTSELYEKLSPATKAGYNVVHFGRALRKLAPQLSMFSGIHYTPPVSNGAPFTLFRVKSE